MQTLQKELRDARHQEESALTAAQHNTPIRGGGSGSGSTHATRDRSNTFFNFKFVNDLNYGHNSSFGEHSSEAGKSARDSLKSDFSESEPATPTAANMYKHISGTVHGQHDHIHPPKGHFGHRSRGYSAIFFAVDGEATEGDSHSKRKAAGEVQDAEIARKENESAYDKIAHYCGCLYGCLRWAFKGFMSMIMEHHLGE